MNVILFNINPAIVYIGIAIIIVAVIVQVILLMLQARQSDRLEKGIQELYERINRLKEH
jgi:membrane protein insertase Oxa1/YidC/SpoIIIJ